MKCRHCGKELTHTFIDLGSSPPSNSYLTEAAMNAPEKWYPLKVLVCDYCWLVQTEDFVCSDEMFSEDYAYFSSYSSSWLDHAKIYVNEMVKRFHLTDQSNIVEIAANDGYLLQYVKEKNIHCYGIEPTHSTAMVARAKGIEIIEEFFGEQKARELVEQGRQADLIAANNVLAHVPDINDFVKGFSILLKPEGVATFEFPHLLNIVEYNQFDTIYHEHYSYFSLTSVQSIFNENGLDIFDVEEIQTHGGSLRIYSQRSDFGIHEVCSSVLSLLSKEKEVGMLSLSYYRGIQSVSEKIKFDLLKFLITAKQDHKKVVAYGAAAKGSTIINYSGIRNDLIDYVADLNPSKQDRYMPGSRIPIVAEDVLRKDCPDYVLILPWNLTSEIIVQLNYIREWGGKFVSAIPVLTIQ